MTRTPILPPGPITNLARSLASRADPQLHQPSMIVATLELDLDARP
ncbi:MAG: hypothetical protein MZW92_35640 [Comamonadaceae bacterium]|nr:hypothetical protein [Comamonadaceae bacterium]